jgi:hypothetical protein
MLTDSHELSSVKKNEMKSISFDDKRVNNEGGNKEKT